MSIQNQTSIQNLKFFIDYTHVVGVNANAKSSNEPTLKVYDYIGSQEDLAKRVGHIANDELKTRITEQTSDTYKYAKGCNGLGVIGFKCHNLIDSKYYNFKVNVIKISFYSKNWFLRLFGVKEQVYVNETVLQNYLKPSSSTNPWWKRMFCCS